MKKLLALFALCLCAPAMAEVVSTVSFNPARMGAYQFLKVSRDANFQGGLDARVLNITTAASPSSGGVSMTWASDAGAAVSERYYLIPTVNGASTNVTVEMLSTTFLNQNPLTTTDYSSYAASSAMTPSAGLLPAITINGGTLDFNQNNDSYVKSVRGANASSAAPLQFYTTNSIGTKVQITGSNGNPVDLTNSSGTLSAEQTLGFHLAGVDIPHPTGHTVNREGDTVTEDASLDLSTCQLSWVKRTAEETASNGTTTTKPVYVLAFANCGGTTPTPQADCSDRSYKLSHKSECCTSNTNDADCWTRSYKWSGRQKLPVGSMTIVFSPRYGTLGNPPDGERCYTTDHKLSPPIINPAEGILDCGPLTDANTNARTNSDCYPQTTSSGVIMPKCLYSNFEAREILPNAYYWATVTNYYPDTANDNCSVTVSHWTGHVCEDKGYVKNGW